MDYTKPEEEIKTSKINSAALMNFLLTDLWKDANRHARNGQLNKFSNDLDCIWIQLGGDEDEDSPACVDYAKLEEELEKSKPTKKSGGFKNGADESSGEQLTKFYRILMKEALFLRRLQNKQGKGTAYHDGTSDYMD